MKLIRIIVIISLIFSGTVISFGKTRVHCSEDTVIVMKMIVAASAAGDELGERVVAAAKVLEGTPWATSMENDSIGTLAINLHGFDRLNFINYSLAAALASRKSVATFQDFEKSLEKVNRRKGEDSGFPSQLFYGSEWIVDNVYRGNLKEMTEYLTGGGFKTKTLDYITRHKEEFPALKEPEVLDKVKLNEMGYRSHRIPHLKKQSAGNKSLAELLQTGDIIIMLPHAEDYDIYDIGFVEMKAGVPYLIHISTLSGNVTQDDYPLSRLFKLEGQHFYGYRWVRPTE